MENAWEVLHKLSDQLGSVLGFPEFPVSAVDIIEVMILTVIIYHFLLWVKSTRAWNLFKGLLAILLFVLVAAVFQMSTILWIARNMLNVGLIALVIIFQPELRKALENLGGRPFISRFINVSRAEEEKFSDRTIEEIVKACSSMSKVKTGALIVIENEIVLDEYIRTGIDLDAKVSGPLLINIFEKNTPLHDGAVIMRGNRIVSATCYLPLSDNLKISKDLGTRHRAALGVSENSDSLTIVVSEETGKISVAIGGIIERELTSEGLRGRLKLLQKKDTEDNGMRWLRRRLRNGK